MSEAARPALSVVIPVFNEAPSLELPPGAGIGRPTPSRSMAKI